MFSWLRNSIDYKKIAVICAILLALLLPFFLSGFRVYQLTMVYVYSIAIVGVNILVGYCGQVSLGHCTFYAIGAYCAAIMHEKWGIDYLWTLPIATAVSFLAGLLIGAPAARLHNISVTVATFGLAVCTPQLLKYFDSYTGGAQGLTLSPVILPSFIPLGQETLLYLSTLLFLVVLLLLAKNLISSRSGRAIMAIRDNPIAAQTFGVNVWLYKTLTFAVSAAYTGLAGALGAIVVKFIAPDFFFLTLSFSFIVGVVVGGTASLIGSIAGAWFVLFIPNLTEDISKAAPSVIFGCILIACMYVMPNGIAGLFKRNSQ